MKIALLHSSRGRPDAALNTAAAWFRDDLPRNTDRLQIEYRFGVEAQEISQYGRQLAQLQAQHGDRFRVRIFDGTRITLEDMDHPGFVFPSESEMPGYLTANTKMAMLAKEAAFQPDWYITIADHFYPAANWFEQLLPVLERYVGCNRVLGYANQCERLMISHPIMTSDYFVSNDQTFMYQGYFHTHGDSELFLQSSYQNQLTVLPVGLNPNHQNAYVTQDWDNLARVSNHTKSYAQADPIFLRRKEELKARYGIA